MSDQWREVVAEWKGDMAFIGHNPGGGSLQMGSLEGKPGISPMELMLLGVAGCTGMDIVSILHKKRLDLQDFRVEVRGKRADAHPKVYTEIHVLYSLWGHDLPTKEVEQAIQLSEEKYCSASAMLRASARIESTYRIYSPGQKADNSLEGVRNG